MLVMHTMGTTLCLVASVVIKVITCLLDFHPKSISRKWIAALPLNIIGGTIIPPGPVDHPSSVPIGAFSGKSRFVT